MFGWLFLHIGGGLENGAFDGAFRPFRPVTVRHHQTFGFKLVLFHVRLENLEALVAAGMLQDHGQPVLLFA